MNTQIKGITMRLAAIGLTVLLYLALQFSALAGPVANEVRLLSWSVSDIDALKAALLDSDKVRTLLGELFGDDEIVSSVGDYRIEDIDNDSYAEVVVTYDLSGRGFYNTIMVIRKNGNKLEQNVIQGFGIGKLEKNIIDIDGDNIKEIVVPRLIGAYQGFKPMAIVPYIYRFQGGVYSESSSAYRAYYINTIKPPIQKSLDDINQGRTKLTEEEKPLWIAKYQTELDTINKIIGE